MVVDMNQPSVLITGGAKRVGRSIAIHLARQGYPIAIHYRHAHIEATALVDELKTMGGKACAVQADFASDFDADALYETAADVIGPIHHLINSASLYERDTLADQTTSSFHRHQQINLYAPLAMIQALREQCLKHAISSASVINLGDGVKGWSLSSKFLSYAISKIGLAQLSELLAPELAPTIRINTLALGLTLLGESDDAAMYARLADQTLMKQPSSTDDVCDAVSYLLHACNVTGQTIWLSGGMHVAHPSLLNSNRN